MKSLELNSILPQDSLKLRQLPQNEGNPYILLYSMTAGTGGNPNCKTWITVAQPQESSIGGTLPGEDLRCLSTDFETRRSAVCGHPQKTKRHIQKTSNEDAPDLDDEDL